MTRSPEQCEAIEAPGRAGLLSRRRMPAASTVETMTAVVLAGGQGTRLRSVVDDRPKPMAQVSGRPFVEWLLLAVQAEGLRHVVLATGYRGEIVEAHFRGDRVPGLELLHIREPVPLGTGGAVRHALHQCGGDLVLVLNGDSFCRIDVRRLVDVHRRRHAAATLWLVPEDDCRRYGTVQIADDGRVLAFAEKSALARVGLISAGIYLFDRSVLEAIPDGRAVSLESEIFPALVGRGLHAVVGEGPFLDIGTPESYAVAEAFITRYRSLWPAVS